MTLDDAHRAVNFILEHSKPFAQAKADRTYLEKFKDVKKALLMSACDEKTAAGKEMYALAHPEYLEVISGLRDAVEKEETYKWQLEAAKARIEVLRSQESTNRLQDRAAQ